MTGACALIKPPTAKLLLFISVFCASAACTNATQPEGPNVSPNAEAPRPSIAEGRALARANPEEAITMIASMGDPERLEQPWREVLTLAHTKLFNAALKSLAAEDDLKRAVADAMRLAEAPEPKNKARLAAPVWGLVGKLESRAQSEPAFVSAAATRLQQSGAIAQIVGPQLTQRLSAMIEGAEVALTQTRTASLIETMAIKDVVDELVRWSSRTDPVSRPALGAAMELVINALEIRSEGANPLELRLEALSLLKAPSLIEALEDGARRVDTLITKTGRAEMARLAGAITRAGLRVDKLAEAACEAEAFAHSAEERRALEERLGEIRTNMIEGASQAAKDYLSSIGARRFKAWQKLEEPFLGADKETHEDFRASRGRWLQSNPRFDPAEVMHQIERAEVAFCKPSVSLGMNWKAGQEVAVELTMCWHTVGAWFPCRPLTRTRKGAMVAP